MTATTMTHRRIAIPVIVLAVSIAAVFIVWRFQQSDVTEQAGVTCATQVLEPLEAACAAVAAESGAQLADIRVLLIEPRTWEDTCLGIPAEELCGAAGPDTTVPGYRVELASGATRFVFHTDH